MRILIVADPIASFKTYKDSTYAIMQAAVARGHALAFCEQPQLWLEGGSAWADAQALELAGPQLGEPGHDPQGWWRLGAPRAEKLAAFDAVLMRKGPAVRPRVRLLDLPARARRPRGRAGVQRSAGGARPQREVRDRRVPRVHRRHDGHARPGAAAPFVQKHGEAVFKLLDGMGGASIFRARAGDPNLSVIVETMNQFGARSVMAQRYLPQIADGDKRVLLIGGRVVPFALARIRSSANRAATSPPAAPAARSRCRRATARSPSRSRRGCTRAACSWSGST